MRTLGRPGGTTFIGRRGDERTGVRSLCRRPRARSGGQRDNGPPATNVGALSSAHFHALSCALMRSHEPSTMPTQLLRVLRRLAFSRSLLFAMAVSAALSAAAQAPRPPETAR